MDEREFDKFAAEYTAIHANNVRVTGEKPEYFAEYKVRDVSALLTEIQVTQQPRILDFGAGIGSSVAYWHIYLPGADITCLDVSARSIELGKARNGNTAQFVHFDGISIPFPSEYFDVAFAACVFHHVDHGEHVNLFRELRRVLKRGGVLVVYEHNPYNPLTVYAVNTCVFDENAKLVRPKEMKKKMQDAGFPSPLIRYRVFFPKALRRLRFLERKLMWLPLGAQYYAAAQNY